MKGIEVPKLDNKIYARELFLSLNHWMLDYTNDGKRQGYPLDFYLLYFHRWGSAKRIKRQVTGNRKLTREFNCLPKEFMLAQHLKNPDYVDLVLGDIEQLPEKLAEVGSRAESFSSWLKKQNIHNIRK